MTPNFLIPSATPLLTPVFFTCTSLVLSIFPREGRERERERERERVNLDLRVIKRLLSYVKRKRGGGEGGKEKAKRKEGF